METLKYKVIGSEKQYNSYCKALETLVFSKSKSKSDKEEIALLNLLIEKWDEQQNKFAGLDPVQLLKSLMKDHKMKSYQLAGLLEVSEGLVSDMLNYKKGFSKETIRIVAEYFKLNQSAFNKSYKLQLETKLKPHKVISTVKKRKVLAVR